MSTIAGVYNLVQMALTEEDAQRFLVEWYGTQAPTDSIAETADRLNSCAASTSIHPKQVRLLAAMAVPLDDYAFAIFASESAELVAEVCRDAGTPPQRISCAVGWMRTQDY